MSREGFSVPTGDLAAAAHGAVSKPVAGAGLNKNYGVKYLCPNCSFEVSLNKSDPIRCKDCGYRVLFKKRTKRMVQFEAR